MGAGTLQSDWDTKPTPPPRTSNNSRPILLWFVQSMNQTRKLVRSMDPMPCLRSAPFMPSRRYSQADPPVPLSSSPVMHN